MTEEVKQDSFSIGSAVREGVIKVYFDILEVETATKKIDWAVDVHKKRLAAYERSQIRR